MSVPISIQQNEMLPPTGLLNEDANAATATDDVGEIYLAGGAESVAMSVDEDDDAPSQPLTGQSHENDSQSELRDLKEEPKDIKSERRDDSVNDDDGRLCPICLDIWTNTGDHRICSLKCGHLFGWRCLNRWFEMQNGRTCPTCKQKVRRSDVRHIYANKLIAADATEIELLKRQIEIVAEDRNRVQLELTKAVCREHLLTQQVQELRAQLSSLSEKQQTEQRSSGSVFTERVSLYREKSLEICKWGACRVIDASSKLDLVVASIKSPNNLFTGYGVRKINISSCKPTAFVPLHTQAIRDVCLHPVYDLIMTVSLDKSFKIIDNNTNSVSHAVMGSTPLWSCCWDVNDHNLLYLGTSQGSILKYDIRQISEPINTLSVQGDMAPVVSVASIAAAPGQVVPNGGVISCKLSTLWVFENSNPNYILKALPLEGPFISMKFKNATRELLVSSRANHRTPYSRHILCNMQNIGSDNLNCNVVHTFIGGGTQTLLSRSCFLSHNEKDYVAAHHETSKGVFLWSVATGRKVYSVPAREPVIDLCGVKTGAGTTFSNLVLSLTERKIEFFKFT